jgi:hypothetical protein
VHGSVSWRGRASLPPTRSAAAPHANHRPASKRRLNGQSRAKQVLAERLRAAYLPDARGITLFPFKRLFLIGSR